MNKMPYEELKLLENDIKNIITNYALDKKTQENFFNKKTKRKSSFYLYSKIENHTKNLDPIKHYKS